MTKGLKTFNLHHSTIAIVRKKPNQSEFVDRAIRRLHNAEKNFRLIDLNTEQIMKHLLNRGGCPEHIKAVIRAYFD